MRIEAVEIIHVAMPLVYPFRTAFGDNDTIESVLVRLRSGGLEGWGESAPWRDPAYSPECAAGVFLVAKEFLAPRLLGVDVERGGALQELLGAVKGNPFAKAAFDMAWWDLQAQQRGEPLWRVLGGVEPVVDVGADFGVMESIEALLEAIGQAMAAGYKRVKLKYRPGWELDMVRAVRARFPDMTFHVDCNSAYTLGNLAMFKELDGLGLAMIEQPLAHDDLVDHARLQQELDTPICLDESITSPDKARKAIALGACGYVNIKPGRVGGITPALAIHDLCQEAGVPCWVGGMLESAVGAAHCLALATLPNIRYPSDIFPSARFYVRDLGAPSMVHSGPSQFDAGEAPGLGRAPEPEVLEACAVERVLVEA